jgi:hypothetical protein
MAPTSRVLMTPVVINNFAISGSSPGIIGAVAPSAGIDATGSNTAFATAWPGIQAGINYVNNGSQFLWGYNGANACTAYVLIGQKAGGQVQIYTTYSITLPVSGYFVIPPLSPVQYNQQDSSQFVSGTGNGGAAPGGQILTTGIGTTCIDFNATTASTVAVRLYQMATVTP